MEEETPIIDDPLAWQDRIDATGLQPNTRGSVRFWATVEALGLSVWARDGTPDFTEIVIPLRGCIGLRLWVEEDSPFIHYGFCELQVGP